MAKKVQVLGINIDNHTVRELMFLLDEYVNSAGVSVAGVLTPEWLVAASENPNIHQLLENMDLRIVGDPAILEVLEETYEQQAAEIRRRDLEEIFLNALIQKRKLAYWISDDETDMPILKNYMEEHYPKLNIAGSYTGVINEECVASVVNEINSVAPDVVLLQTASLEGLELFFQHKNQLNVKLCVCMGYRVKSKYWSPNRNSKIKSLIDQTMFKRKAMRYQVEHEEG